jgi:hypothetical protein
MQTCFTSIITEVAGVLLCISSDFRCKCLRLFVSNREEFKRTKQSFAVLRNPSDTVMRFFRF